MITSSLTGRFPSLADKTFTYGVGQVGRRWVERLVTRSDDEPSAVFWFPRATMSDRKAVIKNADMSEDMQQDAVECATQALEKYNIEKDIAAYIKKVTSRSV